MSHERHKPLGAALALCGLLGVGACSATDPCDGQSGTCLAIDVQGPMTVDTIDLILSGVAQGSLTSRLPGGVSTLPVAQAVLLPEVSGTVVVNGIALLAGKVVGIGKVSATVAQDGQARAALVMQPATSTCDDGIQDGNETGVDCGGSCVACPTSNDPCADRTSPWPSGAVAGGSYLVRQNEQLQQIPYMYLPNNFTITIDPSVTSLSWTVGCLSFGSGATLDLSAPQTVPAATAPGTDQSGQPADGQTGQSGGPGSPGQSGAAGVGLDLTVTKELPGGSLWIRTDGGPGGPGGRGGNGQTGGGSTCGNVAMGQIPTSGGTGGNGGAGGAGGTGGATSAVSVHGVSVGAASCAAQCGPSTRPTIPSGDIVAFGAPGCGGAASAGGMAGAGGDQAVGDRSCSVAGQSFTVTPGANGNAGAAGAAGSAGTCTP